MMKIIRKIVYISYLICLVTLCPSAPGVMHLTSAHTCVDINK